VVARPRLRLNALRLAAALPAAIVIGGVAAWLGAGSFDVGDQKEATAIAVVLLAVGIVLIALHLRRGDLASPLIALGLLTALEFGVRPLYLLANHAVLTAYLNPSSAAESLSRLQSQEIVWFFAVKTGTPPPRAILIGVCLGAIFAASFIVGYARAPFRRRPKPFASRTLDRAALRSGIAFLIAASLFAQAYVVARAGGLSGALAAVNTQQTVQLPGLFVIYVLLNGGTVALMVWLVVLRTKGLLEGGVFAALLAERVLFGLLTGSRSSAFMPLIACAVAAHYGLRRWRAWELAVAAGVLLAAASMFAVFREATRHTRVGSAEVIARKSLPGPRQVVNDITEFDALVEMVALPAQFPPRDGGRLREGALSLVPRGLYIGGKPPTGDVQARATIWGSSVGLAGRPYTAVGELWWDFRWLGVAVGGLVLGYVLKAIRILVSRVSPSGLRGCWEATQLLAVVSLLFGGYDLGASVAFSYAAPLFVVTLLARRPARDESTAKVPQAAARLGVA
jgi:hypothetical protein